ncbi:hypothetical protein LNP26_03365 [Klebsiella variicola subsp. variicola]|nr:hypothetical protein [Klebsiella variicola subsp. variicola]
MVERAAALTATPRSGQGGALKAYRYYPPATACDSGALMERLIAQNPASFSFRAALRRRRAAGRQPGAAAA